MGKEQLIPDISELVSEELKQQLIPIFARMNQKVVLKAVLDYENEKSIEMGAFLKAIAGCSEWIEVAFYEKGEDAGLDEDLHTQHLPVVGLYREGYSGVCFHGTPGGKEINSFVAAVCTFGGGGTPLDRRVAKYIASFRKPIHMKVFVSLSCHHCPHMVAACQKIAIASEYVSAEMYDARLYPDLLEQYKIERIPMTIINDSIVVMGQKSLEEMVNKILNLQ